MQYEVRSLYITTKKELDEWKDKNKLDSYKHSHTTTLSGWDWDIYSNKYMDIHIFYKEGGTEEEIKEIERGVYFKKEE